MKRWKRFQALLLCVILLCSSVAFAACGDEDGEQASGTTGQNAQAGNTLYKVTVVDGFGVPYTEKLIVKFMKDGSQVAMATIDGNGVAEKELPTGEYAIEIVTTDSGKECYYDSKSAIVKADAAETKITMAYIPAGDLVTFEATSPSTGDFKEYQAPTVGVGSSYIELEQEDRTYVVFMPTEGGIYQFSVTDDTAWIGYYGAPHFVQENCLSETVNNTFTVSVPDSGISADHSSTTRLVIGLDVEEGAAGAILNIQRLGDTEWSIADEPWISYQPKRTITSYEASKDLKLKAFDLTAPTVAYKLVFNTGDGYYHLNSTDGPLVFVQLGNECYGISLKNMLGENIYVDGVLMQSGSTSLRYMYDNGQEDFFKEDYTDMMREYITKRDQRTGVYPMTEDLYYALTMGIQFQGWCNPDTADYRFAELAGVNNEISWLFLCAYEDLGVQPVLPNPNENSQEITEPTTPSGGGTGTTVGGNSGSTGTGGNASGGSSATETNGKPIEDHKEEPIEIGGTLNFDAQVKANHLVYYSLYRVSDTTLKIMSSDAYVVYNRKTYYPKNGVVTVPNLKTSSTNLPVNIAIGNQGTADAVFSVTLSYPEGHQMNPYKMQTGALITKSDAGNSQGLYYTFTATQSGILTVTLESVSGGYQGNIAITSKKISGGTIAVDLRENPDSDGKSVSFTMSAGETVTVQIGILPDNGFNYPEATIQTMVHFR